MLQPAALRGLGIAQQRAGRAERGAQAIGAKAGQRGDIQLLKQRAMALDHVEVPFRHALGVHGGRAIVEHVAAIGAQDFGRRDALEFMRQTRLDGARVARKFHQAQIAAGQRQPGQTRGNGLALGLQAQGEKRALGFFGQQVGIGQRTGRDDAHDLAFNRAFRQRRVADLLADRARLSQFHQLGQIAIE
jgi:hypothetical protein